VCSGAMKGGIWNRCSVKLSLRLALPWRCCGAGWNLKLRSGTRVGARMRLEEATDYHCVQGGDIAPDVSSSSSSVNLLPLSFSDLLVFIFFPHSSSIWCTIDSHAVTCPECPSPSQPCHYLSSVDPSWHDHFRTTGGLCADGSCVSTC
jgi:hypothetical protein